VESVVSAMCDYLHAFGSTHLDIRFVSSPAWRYSVESCSFRPRYHANGPTAPASPQYPFQLRPRSPSRRRVGLGRTSGKGVDNPPCCPTAHILDFATLRSGPCSERTLPRLSVGILVQDSGIYLRQPEPRPQPFLDSFSLILDSYMSFRCISTP
jgi:hypothetical protein